MSAGAAGSSPVVSAREAVEILNRAGAALTGSLAVEVTLAEVVAVVVPAIADWSALLVVDEDGTEREITSGYPDPEVEEALLAIRRRRRRETGGSESLEVLRTGRPILASDVTGAPAPDMTAAELDTVARMAPRSYMLVPLRARGRVVGSLTLLSAAPGRHYTPEDLAFAVTLAGRFALALDNARLYETASRSLGLLDTLFASAPVGLAFVDPDRRFVRVNEALAAMHGLGVGEHLGRTVEEVLGAAGAPVVDAVRAVLADGRAVLDREISAPQSDGTADERHFVSSFTPVRGLKGEMLGVAMAIVDNTERRRLLDAERAARLQADFLVRAGQLLDTSLDYEQTLRTVARIAVPEIADWCSIRILDAEGDLRHVVTAHANPSKQALAEEYERRFPPDPGATTGVAAVARSGVAQVVREITDEMLVAAIPDGEQREMVRALGLRSLITAPLVARQRTLGTVTLATAETDRRFGDADVGIAEELARRAGIAIDNARLYTERSRIAHTLQARLLPDRLPELPGALLAARYRAAGELNEVGGDFYDAFARGEGEWALLVGDVSGKGAEGAAVTALARYTLRSACLEDGPPSDALRRLNAAMLTSAGTEFVTVALAYVSPAAEGGLRVRLVLGGHPPPVLRRGDGRVEAVGEFGRLLGDTEDPPLTDTELILAPGDVMLLYTDGVTEAGPTGELFGEEGIAALLTGHPDGGPDDLVDAVERAAVDAQPGEPRDDIALLAIAAR